MIVYVRANDSMSDIRYYEEYGECAPLDRATDPTDIDSVTKPAENDCYDLCNQDWGCYAFHYKSGDCHLWKNIEGVRGFGVVNGEVPRWSVKGSEVTETF
jgi:hypothetical protein